MKKLTIEIQIDAHGLDCADCDFLYWGGGPKPRARCEIFMDYPQLLRGEAIRLPKCIDATVHKGE